MANANVQTVGIGGDLINGFSTGDKTITVSATGTLAVDSSATVTGLLKANGDGSALTGLTKSQVGLGNVDNTSDANKPISTATQTALDGKQAVEEVKSSSFTAVAGKCYVITSSATVSDPESPVNGQSYRVRVSAGTATTARGAYSLVNCLVVCAYNSGAWSDTVYPSAFDADGKLISANLPDEIDARVQVLSGTDAALATEVLELGELAAPTDGNWLRKGDGVTAGGTRIGFPLRGLQVFVDSVNGSDATGTRGNATLPFLTLLAAQTAASSGDTIIVGPGTYTGKNLGKSGVAWFFLPNAVYNATATASNDCLFNTGGRVSGFGQTFTLTVTSDSVNVIGITAVVVFGINIVVTKTTGTGAGNVQGLTSNAALIGGNLTLNNSGTGTTLAVNAGRFISQPIAAGESIITVNHTGASGTVTGVQGASTVCGAINVNSSGTGNVTGASGSTVSIIFGDVTAVSTGGGTAIGINNTGSNTIYHVGRITATGGASSKAVNNTSSASATFGQIVSSTAASVTGTIFSQQGYRVAVPANSAAAGFFGQWASDDTYFYYYGATQWYRVTGSTF